MLAHFARYFVANAVIKLKEIKGHAPLGSTMCASTTSLQMLCAILFKVNSIGEEASDTVSKQASA